MTEDEFFERYEPIKNDNDSSAAYDGCAFDPREYHEYVTNNDVEPDNVWTIMEDDDGDLCISAGWSFVNRFAYLITKNPALGLDEENYICDKDNYE